MEENQELSSESGTTYDNEWWSDFLLGVLLGQTLSGAYVITSEEK